MIVTSTHFVAAHEQRYQHSPKEWSWVASEAPYSTQRSLRKAHQRALFVQILDIRETLKRLSSFEILLELSAVREWCLRSPLWIKLALMIDKTANTLGWMHDAAASNMLISQKVPSEAAQLDIVCFRFVAFVSTNSVFTLELHDTVTLIPSENLQYIKKHF